ncbi:hypothetical protein M9H77_11133 [Catharanthus roseus]|uniref:Uncharacterized protein n=1 Tax=Catharanthus roseus TaxID=4058 RepID=A0ACC0BDN7_CATRO|nr:hypothetical protein M9H77_11133 [Catharanthus roseus]
MKIRLVCSSVHVVAHTRNPDWRFDHVVSQLPKTLSMANFRAYHARLLTRNGIISVRLVNLIVVVIDGSVQHRRMKAPSLSFKQSRDWDPYLDNAQQLCVIFSNNAQRQCVINQDNAQPLCVIKH